MIAGWDKGHALTCALTRLKILAAGAAREPQRIPALSHEGALLPMPCSVFTAEEDT